MGPCPVPETPSPFIDAFRIDGDSFQHDGPDEAAVDHPAGLAEDDVGIGVLLVHRVEAGDFGFVLHEGLQGLAAAGQGDEDHIGVPLVQEFRHDLGGTGQDGVQVVVPDETDPAVLVIRILKIDFCHIESFSAKIAAPSAKLWQKLFIQVRIAGGSLICKNVSLNNRGT